jgi:hypothetical protein
VATIAPVNAAAYLSSEVGRNVSTGGARIGGVTEPGLNAKDCAGFVGSLSWYTRETHKGE